MSRLGKKPVPIPEKVKVSVEGAKITAAGPLGSLTREFPDGISAQVKEKEVLVARDPDDKAVYERNYAAYSAKIDALDVAMVEATASVPAANRSGAEW